MGFLAGALTAPAGLAPRGTLPPDRLVLRAPLVALSVSVAAASAAAWVVTVRVRVRVRGVPFPPARGGGLEASAGVPSGASEVEEAAGEDAAVPVEELLRVPDGRAPDEPVLRAPVPDDPVGVLIAPPELAVRVRGEPLDAFSPAGGAGAAAGSAGTARGIPA